MARTGIFGGTFDPPHVGHFIVAQDVVERLALDRLLLIPAATPPHKPDRRTAPGAARQRMLEAAVAGDGALSVDRVELERGGISYTVDTLRGLRERWPGDELFLLIGADQLRGFAGWRDPEEVVRLAHLVVMARDGVEPEPLSGDAAFPHRQVQVTRVDISSTEVRRRVAEGRSIRYWVPEAVRRIIEEESLYAGP